MNKFLGLFIIIIVVLMGCQSAAPLPLPTNAAPTPVVVTEPAATEIPATQVVPTKVAPTEVPPTASPPTATPDVLLYKDASQPVEARVKDLLGRMTLDEKIGQMTQIEFYSITPAQVTQNAIGSVLSGGGSYQDDSPQAWRGLVESYEQAALKTRLGIPLLFGLDAVHGDGHVKGAVYYPQNVGMGATHDVALAEKVGRATAEDVAAMGVQWDFSPVVAVPQDIRWGRTYEGYSENTDLVTQLSTAYVKGLQQINGKTDLANPQTVLATPKHFIGDGGTKFGTSKTVDQVQYLIDQGDTQMDEAKLRALFLPPYKSAVDAGAEVVMASFSSWNGVKMHAQKKLLTDVLKGELGFKGFIISDWQAIDQINPDYYQSVVSAINAGIDMTMVPYDKDKYMTTLKQAVDKGDVPMSRIDDAVSRILTVKFNKGLFEQPIPKTDPASILNNTAHKALARQAVQESLVLLDNKNQTLPLKKDVSTIFVAGEGADATGYQNGGWTLEWQGVPGDAGGTSILQAVKKAVSPKTRVEFNKFGNFTSLKDAQGNQLKADVSILVIAEAPYAEGRGDRSKLDLDSGDILRLDNLREVSNKIVVILLSGRPMVITQALPLTDAFVAAWLPGSEGEGITDVLFGDVPFTGKTPYTWPRNDAQLPFDFGNMKTDGCDAPLFPYGFGLTTGDPSPKLLDCK
jgi:beta-glucosidase